MLFRMYTVAELEIYIYIYLANCNDLYVLKVLNADVMVIVAFQASQ